MTIDNERVRAMRDKERKNFQVHRGQLCHHFVGFAPSMDEFDVSRFRLGVCVEQYASKQIRKEISVYQRRQFSAWL